MHLENRTPAKEMVQLNESLIHEHRVSCLEEDLALSSSTHDTISEKTTTELEDKSLDEETESSDSPAATTTRIKTFELNRQNDEPIIPITVDPTVVYEDAMDCNYDESSSTTTLAINSINIVAAPTMIAKNLQLWTSSRKFELPDPETSPEMFCESDADDEAESTNTTSATTVTTCTTTTLEEPAGLGITQISNSKEEMILRADKYLLKRINKFLSGVPPPPSHTISQKNCDDFLEYIKQNRIYFWADPFSLKDENKEYVDIPLATSSQLESSQQEPLQISQIEQDKTIVAERRASSKAGMRNLSLAFDECERSSHNESSILDTDELNSTAFIMNLTDSLFNTSVSTFAPLQNSKIESENKISDNKDKGSPFNLSLLSTSTFVQTQNTVENENTRLDDNSYSKYKDDLPTLYMSCTIEEAKKLQWPHVFKNRCPELYYNRNKTIEDFENLRMKLCERYIGAETQSTCNVWFSKQVPGSAKKRSLLAKRNIGQSPGKRLSYLAKRRRTFSSANLQILNFPEKKLMLNVRKGPTRKGKSPRGKSPKGKSPRRKTPRSSAKKRIIRRLQLEGPSPRKAKIETSKRALFQSPPVDKPGPSREIVAITATTLSSGANNPKKIKRQLFQRTPKKNGATDNDNKSLSYLESRKRKSEEELEHTRHKWAKSLSFDTTQNLENSSSNANPLRHSTSSVISKYTSSSNGKCELSDAHRKKLLWAVAEALRSEGIGMSHPQFKPFASALAKMVRKYMPDLENKNIPRKPGSTSERMIKLAKRHVFLVIKANNIESTS